jgi:hypothetical protein
MKTRGIAVVDFETPGGFAEAAAIQTELEKHFSAFSRMNRNVKGHAIYMASSAVSSSEKSKR